MRVILGMLACALPALVAAAPPPVTPSTGAGANSAESGFGPSAISPVQDLPAVTEGGVSLPAVKLVGHDRAPAGIRNDNPPARQDPQADTMPVASEEPEHPIVVKSGTTELVRIAKGFLNRIVTPFSDPKVLTASDLDVKKEGSSIYVATNADQPIGIYILPQDSRDSRSVSLTLIPSRIPPRSIELQLPAGGLSAAEPSVAQRWEEADPYVDTLLSLSEKIAAGEIPEGYALSPMSRPVPCSLPSVSFEPGQQLTGTHYVVYVVRVTNRNRSPIELEGHAGCETPGLAMVAPWPRALLEPDMSTELYVAVRADAAEAAPRSQSRPSLLSESERFAVTTESSP